MADREGIPVPVAIAMLLIAVAVIYGRGVFILIGAYPYRAGGNGGPMSILDVLMYLSVVAVLTAALWAVFSCISWAARRISGHPARRGQWLVLMLSAVDVTGFVCLWILPKIT